MQKFELLGDPHLGRSFVNGVPLARRGEREKMVKDQFVKSLMSVTTPWHISMGDLFDKPVVTYDTVMFAAETYIAAAGQNPNTTFVILAGNHDLSRDLEKISAFDIFAEIVSKEDNIVVINTPWQVEGMLFVPWHPTIPAKDRVEGFTGEIAFGHWDIDDFGGDNHNLIPTPQLAAAGFKEVYTGHIHHPEVFKRDGLKVTVVGSMQPYAHGEDATGDWYVSVNLEQIKHTKLDLTNRCVRVLLQPGEVYDLEIDCLQLQVKRIGEADEGGPDVTMGDFSIADLFTQAFDKTAVSAEMRKLVLSQYEEMKQTV